MPAGKLRYYIEIQQFSSVKNDFGEVTKSWTTFANCWAEVKPIKASEYFTANSENFKVSHRVVIRYIEGIKPGMRIIHEGRTFEVVGVRDYFERHQYLELMCEEKVNG